MPVNGTCGLPSKRQSLAEASHEQGLHGNINAVVETAVAAQGTIEHASEADTKIGDARITRSTLQADSFASVLASINNPNVNCSVTGEAAFRGRHTLEQDFEAKVIASTKAGLHVVAGMTQADGAVTVLPNESEQPAQLRPSTKRPAQLPAQSPAQLPSPKQDRFAEFTVVQQSRKA